MKPNSLTSTLKPGDLVRVIKRGDMPFIRLWSDSYDIAADIATEVTFVEERCASRIYVVIHNLVSDSRWSFVMSSSGSVGWTWRSKHFELI
jgi:hypothetical protein